MKVYSPSEVDKYMACPLKWALSKSGWYPNNFGYGEVTAAIGTGIHRGAYEIHKALMTNNHSILPDLREMAIQSGLEASKTDIRRYLDNGCYPIERVEDWEQRIDTQVPNGISAYIEKYPLDRACNIIGAEESFELERGQEGYRGKIDLIIEENGKNAVADLKTKQPFKSAWYKDVFINSFQWSWQMYHYTWIARQELEGTFEKFYLVMIELKPKPVVTMHSFAVQEQYMSQWLHTVKPIWEQMRKIELGYEVPGISNNHYAYGQRCSFYRACLDFKLDENLMRSEYVQLEG
jgi:CRISPR/Cas system-associated exonuclease Cas4 (RecB family)